MLTRLFGGLNLSWPRLIIAAIVIGVLVGFLMTIPAFKDTSVTRIGVIFYWWVLFGTIIIANSKSNIDSALKCFIFFLISQPLIYFIQVPFTEMGWGIFGYYRYWFYWTIATLPMGFVGYWIKRQNIWSAVILAPVIALVLLEALGEFNYALNHFPKYLLSGVSCLIIVAIMIFGVLRQAQLRIVALALAVVFAAIIALFNRATPEDRAFGLSYDLTEHGVTTAQEWAIESPLGERAQLSIEDSYDENGTPTGETFYQLYINGNGNDYGQYDIKLFSPSEVKNCHFEISEKDNSFNCAK